AKCAGGRGSMADRNRRFTVAAVVMPLVFLAMSGLARAATFTVSNTTDPASPMAGDGSLREAITSANTAGGTNNIQFNAGVTGTITVADCTFSGNQATAGSQGIGVGGAIWSEGTLTVTDSTLSGNQATGGS